MAVKVSVTIDDEILAEARSLALRGNSQGRAVRARSA
jgi:hypothetical protein